jgi:hypothetical protein
MGAPLDEVIGPDMVPPAWSETDARSIVQPEVSPFGLFLGNFEPLSPPDPLDPLVVHVPTLVAQQGRDPTITVPAVLARKSDDRRRQRLLVIPVDRLIALCRPGQPQNAASMAFRD